ncbi:MAG: trypsin-like peptidase domain-containing protein [Bacilli bacterium]
MKNKIIYIITIFTSLFIGIGGTVLVINVLPEKPNEQKVIQEVNITETNTIKESVKKVYDSVVTVQSYSDSLSAIGTGFVYKIDDKYGYILTNNHVISDAKTIKINNTHDELVDATVLGSDEFADLAVLRIDKKYAIQVASFGDSTKLEIGDTVFTVGTPISLSYKGSVTKGIISGTNRTVSVDLKNGGDFMMEVLQTNAAINPGNSGGPLVNINGEVVGINTLKLVQDEIEGMGFSIPIEMATSVLDRLEKGEKIKRPLIGIASVNTTDPYALYRNNIYLDKDYEVGIVVAQVEDNSTASQAGFKKGDVILKINDIVIKDTAHFRYVLYKYSVGDTIKIEYERNGETKTVDVKLNNSI